MTDIGAVRRQHATWLALVESGGPFLTLPVLTVALPQGLDPVRKPEMDRLRLGWSTWDAEQHAKDPGRAQMAWLDYVVRDLLDWQDDADFDPPAGKWEHTEPEYGTLTAAAFTLDDPEKGTPAVLGFTVPPGTSLTARSTDGWSASPLDRVAITLREHDIPLGLLTDGRWWGLVWSPRDGATAHALWDSVLWIEDRVTLEAFVTLQGRRRTLGVADNRTLLGMLQASLDSQEEVTDQLGKQVRAAVETLVDSIGRVAERTRGSQVGVAGRYLAGVDSEHVYEAAVAVLMRLVFILAAEERRLLPIDDDLYARSYGIATLGDELDRRAADAGEDALEHGIGAWHRLLAAFRVVHDGADHHEFRLPGYGGGLFDPDRYGWLEGRLADGTRLPPLPVDDRTVRRVIRSLMWLEFHDRGVRENRRVTYRALDVEQIGYVYEGLLDHNATRADGWVLGFTGPKEPEISLDELDAQAAADRGGFAGWLGKQLGKTASWIGQRLGAPADAAARDALWRRTLAATDNDEAQASRVLPFARLLREDQRGLPVIIPPGRFYVTASSARSDTGTHYTPRALAEGVVAGALEPLVYHPGPLQTLDRARWRLRQPATILGLRVADIAMGSGAFLVAACRYLADRLIEAVSAASVDTLGEVATRTLWELLHDQEIRTETSDEEADEALIHARRLVVERCLYGADINLLAVEMAKLSLWLITSAQNRPFTFLDHRLVTGDSLLGLTSLAQIENLHVVPIRGQELHSGTLLGETAHVRRLLAAAAATRHDLTSRPSTDLREVEFKTTLLAQADRQLADLTLLADGLTGAALAGARAGEAHVDGRSAQLAGHVAALLGARPGSPEQAEAVTSVRALAEGWLNTDRPPAVARRRPVQWLTRFPEVFLGTDDPGFDAVIGNPPFLGGQKITGAAGVAYREHLVRHVGGGTRGSADLVAYFLLTAHALLNTHGQLGLIATNTVTQGDTREVGLDRLVAAGLDLRAAIKSRKWPTRGANLEFSVLWGSRTSREPGVLAVADGVQVAAISPALDPAGRVTGNPYRLLANRGIGFIGSYVLGLGFTMSAVDAHTLIDRDPRNADVLFPYVNGEDLNTRPDSSGSRWIINFFDWPEERAAQYPDCYEIVRQRVKPERARNNNKQRREVWWRYTRPAVGLYTAIRGLSHVLAITRVSKVVMPVRVRTGQVLSEACVVFATDDMADFALLSSAPHYWWAISRASTMRNDLRYTPSDVFETLTRPENSDETRGAGRRLQEDRRAFMLGRRLGLTKTYNLVHNPAVTDGEVAQLRRLHLAVDETVCAAYGWADLPLDHGHYETRQGVRWTVSPAAQVELLDRLLLLNQERHAAEAGQAPAGRRGHKMSAPPRTPAPSLFDEEVL